MILTLDDQTEIERAFDPQNSRSTDLLSSTAATEGGVRVTDDAPKCRQVPPPVALWTRTALRWWRIAGRLLAGFECWVAACADALTRDGARATRLD